MCPDLVTDYLGLENPPVNQALHTMDDGHQYAGRFCLGEVAGLGEDYGTDSCSRGFRLGIGRAGGNFPK
jgi:hypothetical protein